MKHQPWKARGQHAAPPPPPPLHGHVPPHVEIIEGLEAVSVQLAEIQATIDELRAHEPAAAEIH